jgi:hypothetical protein
LGISGALAILLLILGVGIVTADLSFSGYIWACDGSGTCVGEDPINIVFRLNGTVANSLDHVSHHLGWSDQGGSNLSFYDHFTVFENMEAQRASACLPCNRYHQRYNQGNDDGGPGWGTWTMGPVHWEDMTWCGHASRTFDGARNTYRA